MIDSLFHKIKFPLGARDSQTMRIPFSLSKRYMIKSKLYWLWVMCIFVSYEKYC